MIADYLYLFAGLVASFKHRRGFITAAKYQNKQHKMKNVLIDGVEYAPVKPVTSKDWEIVSGFYDMANQYTIHSIKRFSDGEVLSIGDTYTCAGSKDVRTIHEFYVHSGGKGVSCVSELMGGTPLKDVIKVVPVPSKRYVLTTHDGVKLYKGDMFWPVYHTTDLNDCVDMTLGSKPLKAHMIDLYVFDFKTFSTEQAAKDYIVENKPGTLSLKDVMDAILNNPTAIRTLKDKIREKLGL